jgi:hypothetical protein
MVIVLTFELGQRDPFPVLNNPEMKDVNVASARD